MRFRRHVEMSEEIIKPIWNLLLSQLLPDREVSYGRHWKQGDQQ